MIRVAVSASAVFVLLLLAVTSRGTAGNAPTVENVLKRIPVLSPANRDLKNFRATVRVEKEMLGVAAIVEVAWIRDKGCSIVICNPSTNLPIACYADGKLMMYDVVENSVLFIEEASLAVQLRATKDKIWWAVGSSDKDSDLRLDLESFYRYSSNDIHLEQKEGSWLLVSPSKSGKSRLVGVVGPNDDSPLRSLRLEMIKSQSAAIDVSNISINEARPFPLRQFPAIEQLPKQIKVERFTKEDGKRLFANVGLFGKWVRVLYGHAALANADLRDAPFASGVDWKKAAEAEKTIGPPFRKLLEFDVKPKSANAAKSSSKR